MQSKTWMDEIEEKKRGWSRDPNGGWIRENPSMSINSMNNMNSLPKSNGPKSNSLWNRRRTSSTTSIPTLPLNESLSSTYHHKRSPTITQQRGSSASPQMPHATKGFWVQEPDDLTQRWVPTEHLDTPKMHAPITSMMWPSTGKQEYVNGGRPPVSGHQKSPMVRSPELPANNQLNQQPVNLEKAGNISMSDGDENIDIANRIKRFQPENQQAMGSTSRTSTSTSTSSSSQQMKRSHLSSNSSNNLNEQITASKTKSSSNVSEVTSTKSEFKTSTSGSKSNISEIKTQNNSMNFSRSASKSTLEQSAGATSGGLNKTSRFGPMGSLEALAKAQGNHLAIEDFKDNLCLVEPLDSSVSLGNTSPLGNQKEMKFEESKSSSSSKTKVVTDNNSYESASGHESESRKVQSGDVSYEESRNKAATKSKLEIDGITAEKAAAVQNEARQLKAGDISIREGSQLKGGSMSISGNGFSANKSAISEQQQRQMVTPSGTINQESSRKASRSGLTVNNAAGVSSTQTSAMASSMNNMSISGFEDFDKLTDFSQPHDVQNAIMKFSSTMSGFVDQLRGVTQETGIEGPSLLDNINYMINRAWNVPSYGHELGSSLCNVLRHNGGLDVLMQNCNSVNDDLKFTSAKVLEQCLTTENRNYVVEKGLETVVGVACDCSQKGHSVDESRVGTGILEHLFKHSEGTCSDIIKLGGLDAVIKECRNTDKDTLQHCAGALANLSLYGGTENHQAMMKQKVEHWLFPLAFHEDDNIKYYACLAIAALVANKEIEAAVLKSGSLSLVEPFVNSHLPEEFANSTAAHKHGQSKSWLKRLVPVLRSNREEACNLAAFHFCMEAGIKKKQGNLEIFNEIKAIESLKEVASSPNAIASKYAAQALTLMGEEVPHKLTQQVPIWSIEDVSEWVKRIGFGEYEQKFRESKVDGDLLLKMNEPNLKEDIQIKNGILRQRFARELKKLKIRADYSSCDDTLLNDFLINIDSDYTEYTYPLLQSGVSLECLRYISDDHTLIECGIQNPIHRNRIRNAIIGEDISSEQGNVEKCLDVFISYRRSNGSQLASLLKVHMSLRSFSTFIDVERLEAGKFDNNLLNSIRTAKHFLLVLTSNALDRCIGDEDCKDWVHREIVAAIQSGCNIIPILDNFQWPEPDLLPEDMRSICYFNGVRWIHDYQDACVDKLERFMRGEGIMKELCGYGRYMMGPTGMTTPGTPSTLPRGAPLFQRTTSIESGKGSSCSDKDFARD